QVIISQFAFYSLDKSDPMTGTALTIRSAGQPTPPTKVQLPPGSPAIVPGPDDRMFLYWISSCPEAAPACGVDHLFHIIARDGTPLATIPLPQPSDPGVEPIAQLAWLQDGGALLTQDYAKRVVVHSLQGGADVDLGIQPASFSIDEGRG